MAQAEPLTYAHGAPCWIDLMTNDLDGTKAFYSQVLGWSFSDGAVGGVPYTMAFMGSSVVAGVSVQAPEQVAAGLSPAWNVYLAVDSAADATAVAEKAGGNVLLETSPVGSFGQMAAVADPTGAVVGLWQGEKLVGCERFGEPGAFSWAELQTDDIAVSAHYMSEAFGLSYNPNDHTLTAKTGGTPVASLAEITSAFLSPHWDVVVSVESMREMMGMVGGTSGWIEEPIETPRGLLAAVQDPQGAMLHVLEPIDR